MIYVFAKQIKLVVVCTTWNFQVLRMNWMNFSLPISDLFLTQYASFCDLCLNGLPQFYQDRSVTPLNAAVWNAAGWLLYAAYSSFLKAATIIWPSSVEPTCAECGGCRHSASQPTEEVLASEPNGRAVVNMSCLSCFWITAGDLRSLRALATCQRLFL